MGIWPPPVPSCKSPCVFLCVSHAPGLHTDSKRRVRWQGRKADRLNRVDDPCLHVRRTSLPMAACNSNSSFQGQQDFWTLLTLDPCLRLQVDYEPSCKLAPRWADVLGAISAGAADPNPASGSSGGASEPSGSLSAASDQGPKLLLPTDCHLGGGLEGGGSDAPTSAAAHARTAAVAAAARARDAAQHQRALGGLKTQASRGGEQ